MIAGYCPSCGTARGRVPVLAADPPGSVGPIASLENEAQQIARLLWREAFVAQAQAELKTPPNSQRLEALVELYAEAIQRIAIIEDVTARVDALREMLGAAASPRFHRALSTPFVTLSFPDLVDKLSGTDVLGIETLDLVESAYRLFAANFVGDLRRGMFESIRAQILRLVVEGGTPRDFALWSDRLSQGHVSDAWARSTFRTIRNLAHNAGRAAQAFSPELDDVVVAMEYHAVGGQRGDGRTRPNHAANSGRQWAKRDAIWHSRLPPNGYQCRCRVLLISRQEAARRGRLDPSGAFISDAVPPEGEPDPGFAFSPAIHVYGV